MDLKGISKNLIRYFNLDKIGNWTNYVHERLESDVEFYNMLIDLMAEYKLGTPVSPQHQDVFRALELINPEAVKVIIIGQDPYPNKSANGLAFSVKKGDPIPPSLKNIFKEIGDDIGYWEANNGDLTEWANQGVFLLNTCLSVEQGKPGSHKNTGWEDITEDLVRYVIDKNPKVLIVCWGKEASNLSNRLSHTHVIKSSHPSPLSSHKGFFGCRHFSKINSYLNSIGEKEINWRI